MLPVKGGVETRDLREIGISLPNAARSPPAPAAGARCRAARATAGRQHRVGDQRRRRCTAGRRGRPAGRWPRRPVVELRAPQPVEQHVERRSMVGQRPREVEHQRAIRPGHLQPTVLQADPGRRCPELQRACQPPGRRAPPSGSTSRRSASAAGRFTARAHDWPGLQPSHLMVVDPSSKRYVVDSAGRLMARKPRVIKSTRLAFLDRACRSRAALSSPVAGEAPVARARQRARMAPGHRLPARRPAAAG